MSENITHADAIELTGAMHLAALQLQGDRDVHLLLMHAQAVT